MAQRRLTMPFIREVLSAAARARAAPGCSCTASAATRRPSACASVFSSSVRTACLRPAHVRGAVGRAAAAASRSGRARCRAAHQQHAVVQERQHHRQQGRLLATVHGLRRGEHAGGLAGEGAREPQASRCRRGSTSAAPPCCRSAWGCRAPARAFRAGHRGSRRAAPLAGTGCAGSSLAAVTAGTVRSRALAPATASTPRHTWRASSAVAPRARVVQHQDFRHFLSLRRRTRERTLPQNRCAIILGFRHRACRNYSSIRPIAMMCKKCLVGGRVQGVFYRATAARRAQELAIPATRAICPTGGSRYWRAARSEAVQAFVKWLWIGSSASKVTSVEVLRARRRRTAAHRVSLQHDVQTDTFRRAPAPCGLGRQQLAGRCPPAERARQPGCASTANHADRHRHRRVCCARRTHGTCRTRRPVVPAGRSRLPSRNGGPNSAGRGGPVAACPRRRRPVPAPHRHAHHGQAWVVAANPLAVDAGLEILGKGGKASMPRSPCRRCSAWWSRRAPASAAARSSCTTTRTAAR